jgi:photosystem II stability/assembly factor-like uncharacterized protein
MKSRRLLFLFVLQLIIPKGVFAQPWLRSPYLTSSPGADQNFYQLKNAFNKYEDDFLKGKLQPPVYTGENKKSFHGAMQFRRWEWYNEQRVFPTGIFPELKQVTDEYERLRETHLLQPHVNSRTAASNWLNLGAAVVPPGSSSGTGRINCIAFLPGNSSVIFIGTACGGVWKSINGGTSWTVLNTDLLPSLSVASIAIDPSDPNKIYIATGDNFLGIPNFGKWLQGHFSAGVFKSTDGGNTWNPTGLTYLQSQLMLPQQLIIDPVTPSTLLLVSNTGIYRTVNSGANWSPVMAGTYYSIEFNPLNSNVVYATNGLGLWRSNNNGATWSYKGGGYPNGISDRVSLGITPADTACIYLWGPVAGFKRTLNGGNSFTTLTNPDPLVLPYGYYDRALAVSKTNPAEVVAGGQLCVRTINGGASWTQNSQYANHLLQDYVHQDVKRLQFTPAGSVLYALSDGGIFSTSNSGAQWTNISHGLQIGEIYRIANNPFNADTVYYGTQDCGTSRWDGTTATLSQVFGSDGMQPLVDPFNSQVLFVCAPYGNLQKSINGGLSFSLASPGQCMWIAPYVMNPVNTETMYIGAKAGVKKSLTGGTFMSWVNVSAPMLDSVIAIAATIADTNVVYAAKLNKIAKTVNGGSVWTDITSTLPVANAGITYIAISNTNANRVYVTFSGYAQGEKVYTSADGGLTWNNYSGTLPNVPVNCISYVNGTNDQVYIGTDLGVFYRDAGSSDWLPFNNGLPNVIVNHLDIHYATQKIRAGTYGRGLWEADLLITGVLPIELIEFAGEYHSTQNVVELNWTTSSESNCDKFQLQKSIDGGIFNSIATIPCAGTTSVMHEYYYTDLHPFNSKNYYRLKQLDYNGSESFSAVISVNVSSKAMPLVLFPNPAKSQLLLDYPGKTGIISIIDIAGRTVYTCTMDKEKSLIGFTIDVTRFAKGFYTVIIKNSDGYFEAATNFVKD